MENEKQKKSIEEKIFENIKEGRLKMKPRLYFTGKTVLLVLGVVLAAFLAVFLFSFIIFNLHLSGAWFMPGFGIGGWGLFLRGVPWLVLFAALLFAVFSESLAQKFSVVYRRPLVYSVIAVFLVLFIGSWFVSRTTLHQKLFGCARQNRPLIGNFYRGAGMMQIHGAYVGVAENVGKNGFNLITDGGKLNVAVSNRTRFPFGVISENDNVAVMGRASGTLIDAAGVRKTGEDFPKFRPACH